MAKTLFDGLAKSRKEAAAPLADRMRPRSLDEVVGQDDLIATESALRDVIEAGDIPSMILWGPPGSGKTTIAKVLASYANAELVELSAVSSGVAEVRQVVKQAEERLGQTGTRTILFIDEIHRFNKAQQDAFLHWVENGTIILIGATTENPSFEVNSALLSRCRVFVLKKLDVTHVMSLLERALVDVERGLGAKNAIVPQDVMTQIANSADGDARSALNILELAVNASKGKPVTMEHVRTILQRQTFLYDTHGEEHYNIISALHKSMRGSDADAALYWLGRMLEAGEDPLFVARRLVRFASEDVGLADPQALILAMSGYHATHAIGMPECNVVLAQVAAYLARAPKSNAIYVAYGAIQRDIRELPNESVPLHLRNAPTTLMKDLGYGENYKYNPSYDNPVEQDYLPEKLKGKRYLNL